MVYVKSPFPLIGFLHTPKTVWGLLAEGGETIMKKVSGYTHAQKQLDNYANQNNPNNAAYHANRNNHANQLNPNNPTHNHGKSSK